MPEFWLNSARRRLFAFSKLHNLIPLEAGRGISAKTCELDDVFSPDDLDSGPYTHVIIIYIPCIIAAFYVIYISSF